MIRLRSTTVGFKEWLLVCEALGAGRQSLIIRKGGIAEGRGGFQWQAAEFFFFPTHFHQQQAQTEWVAGELAQRDLANPDTIAIRWAARVEWSGRVGDWDVARSLQPHHVWKEEVIRERFGYGGETGISVALVRVYRLPSPWILTPEARYGGCRSWVDLPDHSIDDLEPVLDDATHRDRSTALRASLKIPLGD